MASDIQLYVLRHSKFAYMPMQRACEAIAKLYDFNPDSVRGRINRVDKIKANIALLRKTMHDKTDDISPSVARQQVIVEQSKKRFEEWKQSRHGKQTFGMFVSDAHIPYARMDAVELMLRIGEDVKPHAVSAFNDALDNNGYKHPDKRSARALLWSSDDEYNKRAETAWNASLHSVLHDDGVLVDVRGNHDNYWYGNQRENVPQAAESNIAKHMESLYKQGVLQFSRGHDTDEPPVWMAPRLVWWHGQFAARSATANAANSIAQFMENGIASNVVVGHTHRPATIPGALVKQPGVTFYNNGCLCRLDSLPFMKRKPFAWQLAVTVCEWQTYGSIADDYVKCTVVTFDKRGNHLTARHAGKEYRVKYDDKVVDDYK